MNSGDTNQNRPSRTSSLLARHGWHVGLAVGVFSYLGILAGSDTALHTLGIATYGRWFHDLYAILASNDAVVRGIDPYIPNPLDYFHRPHVYTNWWLNLHEVGLTRADTVWLGWTLVVSFLMVAMAGLKPKTGKEAVFYAAALCSSPVLLAMNRANNDLVVFLVLAAAPLCLADSQRTVRLFPVFLIVFAAGLKFFPLAAAPILLAGRDRAELRMRLLIFALMCVIVGISVAGDFARGSYYLPDVRGLFTFGSVAIPNALQISSRGWSIAAWIIGIAAFLAFFARAMSFPAAASDARRDRMGFIMGASLLCACFWLNMNFSYRFVFSLWMLPYLWRVPEDETEEVELRRLARWTRFLLMSVLWLDTIFCLVVNLIVDRIPGANPAAWADRLYLIEQPVTWSFFILLLCFLARYLREQVMYVLPLGQQKAAGTGADGREA